MNTLYFLDKDDDGHNYIVEAEWRTSWEMWLRSGNETVPFYAKTINTHYNKVEFFLPDSEP